MDALGEVPHPFTVLPGGHRHLATGLQEVEQPLDVLVVGPAGGPPRHGTRVGQLAGGERALRAEALEDGLESFDGTVMCVTHDRWFARSFDRFLIFGSDGQVYETSEPVWDEARVQRAR